MPNLMTALIHEYFINPTNGTTDFDDDGEPLIGFYFQLVDGEGTPLMPIMGPYGTAEDAEQASHREFISGDW